ncbi:MAG: 2-phospho-L-lactate guanylyltransferase [Gaiellaceae bacterium]
MVTVVVPFRGAGGKHRLAPMPPKARAELSLAMLGDVLAACTAFGPTTVVTADPDGSGLASDLGAAVHRDPGGGQSAAVASVLNTLPLDAVIIVNADLPCVVPHDLRSLVRATPLSGLAYVPAADGTTNALSLPAPAVFAPLYGPGSAARFHAHATELGLQAIATPIPGLASDIDTAEDLDRYGLGAGPRTQAMLSGLAR